MIRISRKEYKDIFKKINLEKVLHDYNIDYKLRNGKNGWEYTSSCPFPGHNDYSPSFSIRKDDGVYNCYVCGGGNFFKFVKILERFKTIKESVDFIKKKIGYKEIEESRNNFDNLKSKFKGFLREGITQDKNEKGINLKEINLPKCESALKYLSIAKKRVSIKSIRKWDIKYCVDDKKYNGRLIIPIYFDGKLVSFAARDMLGRSKKWDEIKKKAIEKRKSKEEMSKLEEKYGCKKILYPYGSPISNIFFNWDNSFGNDYVILVEGIFDAIRVSNFGYNVVALLSCHLNEYRRDLLIKNFDKFFIALDNDDKVDSKGRKFNPGQDSAIKIKNEYLQECDVYNIVLPIGKDPDDCTEEEFRQCFQESKKFF